MDNGTLPVVPPAEQHITVPPLLQQSVIICSMMGNSRSALILFYVHAEHKP